MVEALSDERILQSMIAIPGFLSIATGGGRYSGQATQDFSNFSKHEEHVGISRSALSYFWSAG